MEEVISINFFRNYENKKQKQLKLAKYLIPATSNFKISSCDTNAQESMPKGLHAKGSAPVRNIQIEPHVRFN